MKIYKVFQHPDGRIEAIKQGWSWPAFFFGIIWAIVKKLWGLAGILFLVAVILSIISFALEPANPSYYSPMQTQSVGLEIVFNIISLIIAIILGQIGNKLRENNLTKRGYQLLNTIEAENPDQAIANVKTSSNNDITINI